jgi:hypothetical protein
VAQHGGYVVARDLRGSLRCSEHLVEPSHTAVSYGMLLHSESHGARGNHDHDLEPTGHRAAGVVRVVEIMSVIPEPMERRTYGMCGVIHFCAAIFLGLLLLSLAPTDA